MNLQLGDIATIAGIVAAIVTFAGWIIKLMIKLALTEHRLKLLSDFKNEYLTIERYEREKKGV